MLLTEFDAPELLLRAPGGALVPLDFLASVQLRTGRQRVLHEGGRRRQTVTCNVRGRDVATFVAEAKAQLAGAIALPAGAVPANVVEKLRAYAVSVAHFPTAVKEFEWRNGWFCL